jgi:hypothetical protein
MDMFVIIGLIGEENYYKIFNGLPHEFFGMNKTTQEGLWGAVRNKIEDGEMDIQKLITFARQWVELYPIVKESIHRGILNF